MIEDGATPGPSPPNVAEQATVGQNSHGSGGGGNGKDQEPPSKLAALFYEATDFMKLAGREWLASLIYQPTDPPFNYDAKFPDESVRVMRLVVMVVLLTGLVVGSERFFNPKTTPTLVLGLAVRVIIGAFLAAIVYTALAFVCGVRVWEQQRKRLTVGQVFFSVLYIFVPWIPIFAFLWSFGKAGGQVRLLVLILLLYLCVGLMIMNFAKALKRVSGCPWYRVWVSVLLPIVLVVVYVLFRT